MNVPNTRSLALHEFAGLYRGVHAIEGDTEAGVGEIAITIKSSGIGIARATLEGTEKDSFTASEVKEVDPTEARGQLKKEFKDFGKAFQLGQQIMTISHRTDNIPSLILLGKSELTALFGPGQMEAFDQIINAVIYNSGEIPRLNKTDC